MLRMCMKPVSMTKPMLCKQLAFIYGKLDQPEPQPILQGTCEHVTMEGTPAYQLELAPLSPDLCGLKSWQTAWLLHTPSSWGLSGVRRARDRYWPTRQPAFLVDLQPDWP